MSHECIPEASLLISHGSTGPAAYPPHAQPVNRDIVAGIHSGNCCWHESALAKVDVCDCSRKATAL